jgi:hypothetical protein
LYIATYWQQITSFQQNKSPKLLNYSFNNPTPLVSGNDFSVEDGDEI